MTLSKHEKGELWIKTFPLITKADLWAYVETGFSRTINWNTGNMLQG
jgi:hypothetical protein